MFIDSSIKSNIHIIVQKIRNDDIIEVRTPIQNKEILNKYIEILNKRKSSIYAEVYKNGNMIQRIFFKRLKLI